MSDQDLSFDEGHDRGGEVRCADCGRSLSEYWTVKGAILCAECKEKRLAELTSPEGAGARFGKAALFGAGGMLAGAAVWAAVEVFGHIQLALIAILLGVLVGKGVFKGSGNRGGRGYQFLALALTWLGYGLASTPSVVQEVVARVHQHADSVTANAHPQASVPLDQQSDSAIDAQLKAADSAIAAGPHAGKAATGTPSQGVGVILLGLGAIALLILALPAIAVFSDGSIILAIIYAVGLWEAWKLSRAVPPEVSGPHSVAAPAA